MLSLNRKCQQSVVIAGDGVPENVLKVTVLKIRGGRVKLGLEVPAGIHIERREVSERRGAGGGQPHTSQGRPAASRQESDRWEDDGGPGVPAGIPAVLHAAIRLASCQR